MICCIEIFVQLDTINTIIEFKKSLIPSLIIILSGLLGSIIIYLLQYWAIKKIYTVMIYSQLTCINFLEMLQTAQ